jgi:pyruvate kinase
MLALRDALLAAEAARCDEIAATHPTFRRSAANLVHYVELRRHDVRGLQSHLAVAGLSSLGRSEASVLATIEAVLGVIARLTGRDAPDEAAPVSITEGAELLRVNADRLLGSAPEHRPSRIMVTLPSEAADDPSLVGQMMTAGMDIARVNCAHDDQDAWARMIAAARSHPRRDRSPCRVAMDLAGPKLRTGPLRGGPRVIKVSPRRDLSGRVVAPARIWLAPTGGPSVAEVETAVAVVPVDDAAWLQRRQPGHEIRFTDHRDARRSWTIVAASSTGCLATAERTAYVATGSRLICSDRGDADVVVVGDLPERPLSHRVGRGDCVVLTRSLEPSEPTPVGAVHRIGCTLGEVFEHARPGHRVWLDDGKFGGTIDWVTSDEIGLTITDVRPGGANLQAGKGINLPDTEITLDALTTKDLIDLDFVAHNADLVNASFVRRPADVATLQHELHVRDADDVGIVLKIENVAAFEQLPDLLLTAMRSPRVGVMIARGDLAVEVGFERLAEVQEEIMWACEAAHVPVIWATQVLDTLARTGQGTRAEVTDAAMAARAECVMLNKGPHITQAIETLDSILTRMHHHQHKKRSLMRRLRAWDHALRR